MSRVSFDDDTTNASLPALQPPSLSSHWLALTHKNNDRMICHMEDLRTCFTADLTNFSGDGHHSTTSTTQKRGEALALWSCVAGYVESITTHKVQRYHIFPIPFGALQRLVQEEFVFKMQSLSVASASPSHRETVQGISNTIWAHVLNKPNTRDEVHANSVYVWLRGRIDRKSLDCFGAALTTIAGCHIRSLSSSQLTLSEDHAYERHTEEDGSTIGTCEVAVPGTTKAAQAKRGKEIAATFAKDANTTLTPETSWLYMASNPVVCDSLPMTLVAVIGNINCTIDKQQSANKRALASGQLYDFKRELLWILYDQGHMSKFPFGLLELGDCEEHRGSPRSEVWVHVDEITEPILQNEKFFWDAIRINKNMYNEAQVYPYFYAGHYHKDAGNEGPDHEYRLAHAMKHYADAARVASKYRYEGIDSLQLNKHMSSAAMLIAMDILTPKYMNEKDQPREWTNRSTAVCMGTWLVGFFDSLLYWEESSQGKQFVEILTRNHKHGIGKLFQLLHQDLRIEIVNKVRENDDAESKQDENNGILPPIFRQVRSTRLSSGSLLLQALQKTKVSIQEMELAILSANDDEGSGRRSKRMRR